MEIFLDGNLSKLSGANVSNFAPFQAASPASQKQLQVILLGSLVSLRKETPIPNIGKTLQVLTQSALESSFDGSGIHPSVAIASIVNKAAEGPELNSFLEEVVKKNLLGNLGNAGPDSSKSLTILAWIARALLMRGHQLGTTLGQEFCKKMESPVGKSIAESFEILMGDQYLNKENHANIKVLYKQKFFLITIPLLFEGFNASAEEFKANYFTAISRMLKHIPKSVLLNEVPALLPLILHSLSTQDSSLRLSSLETLVGLVEDVPNMIVPQVPKLVPNLLEFVVKDPHMNVRIAAIRCLQGFIQFPPKVILPFQKQIVTSLHKVLDDNKRAVRREAAKTQSDYFLLAAAK